MSWIKFDRCYGEEGKENKIIMGKGGEGDEPQVYFSEWAHHLTVGRSLLFFFCFYFLVDSTAYFPFHSRNFKSNYKQNLQGSHSKCKSIWSIAK